MGIEYIQFIYQDNVKLQQEISEWTDQMIALDTEHMRERQKWEQQIAELNRQISLYRDDPSDF